MTEEQIQELKNNADNLDKDLERHYNVWERSNGKQNATAVEHYRGRLISYIEIFDMLKIDRTKYTWIYNI